MKELAERVTTLYTPLGSVVQLPSPESVTKSSTTRPCAVEFTVIMVVAFVAEVITVEVRTGVDSNEVFDPRKMKTLLNAWRRSHLPLIVSEAG